MTTRLISRCSMQRPHLLQNGKQQVAHYYMKPEKQKKEFNWKKFTLISSAATIGILGSGIFVLGHNWSGLEDEFDSLPVHEQYVERAKGTILDKYKYFTEPSSELLLPDLLPPPYQAPYTLLIELNDLMVNASYTRSAGWRHKKRQGLDIFLESLCRHYEIVIFTKENALSACQVVEAIDPKMYVLYKLYRDSTNYEKGVHLKDLTNLNRDLSKVILIDNDRRAVAKQPENALVLPKWMGEDDMDLIDLADMLVVIAQDRPKDVREIIKSYTELDDPVSAYRAKRKQILDAENVRKLESLQKQKGLLGKRWW